MREFIRDLYFRLGFDRIDSCADDKAIYVEMRVNGALRHIKFVPQEVSIEEYDAAWDYSALNERE